MKDFCIEEGIYDMHANDYPVIYTLRLVNNSSDILHTFDTQS